MSHPHLVSFYFFLSPAVSFLLCLELDRGVAQTCPQESVVRSEQNCYWVTGGSDTANT
jgi:hypothetical protein